MKNTNEKSIKGIIAVMAEIKTVGALEINLNEERDAKGKEIWQSFNEKGEFFFTDKSKVCGILIKNKNILHIALGMFDWTDYKIENNPKISYIAESSETGLEMKSKISAEYLQIVLKLCTILEETPIIGIKHDFPIMFEWKKTGITIYIAPRVTDD